jgi:Protein of unknown function (DUF3307)
MTWGEVFLVLLVSHVAGDFLLQTEWQALNKRGGLGRSRESRRALRNHAVTYTAAFLPGLLWIATQRDDALAVLLALLITIPHVIVDDGRLLAGWMRAVKHVPDPAPGLVIMVDQSFHIVLLLPVALLAVV